MVIELLKRPTPRCLELEKSSSQDVLLFNHYISFKRIMPSVSLFFPTCYSGIHGVVEEVVFSISSYHPKFPGMECESRKNKVLWYI